ncbi:P-loop containing nucleoside triphosphate hydrolase protein [Corynespora cassiicola Philippines]|uniref:P-loop containing nucleoside triphosphate hydrolase protein n=1 Tax=Corynespora cassiicola Philippines TaxID=1448308 RepID=A0A2T2NUI1_CORCC|nr:P-loop containing nucleoside triphosphate hydrolase protein [Corynespora cassiicola Philippines]
MQSKNAGDENGDDGPIVTAELKDESFRLRSYQAEMVEESLKSNIIVAMDTGSGKTHIALARTSAELELCEPKKRVWFLAPTVTLCEQQFRVFKANLPGYGVQVLSGQDRVEHWSDQGTWDVILNNIRVVLSTHQVLLDALTHGFVKMSDLSLLIFDEAHHCTSNHPANRILKTFYIPFIHMGPKGGRFLPRILGLSASPVMKANAGNSALQEIERNMNAIAKSPKIHRSELLRFVHKPELRRVDYHVAPQCHSPLLNHLQHALDNYDLMSDPYVLGLLEKRDQGFDVYRQLQKVFQSHSTYCRMQLKNFVSKAKDMSEELGRSASDWYLKQCINAYEKMVMASDVQLFDWTSQEKQHLLRIFQGLPIPKVAFSDPLYLDHVSHKVKILIDLLVSEVSDSFTGLVFVEQRVWVSTLAEILMFHSRTKDIFRIGTFIGTSQSTKRSMMVSSLVEPRNQKDTLDDFRQGKTNLILTTSVLEEGIDVSSCHLVICFEQPKNLKSFVQRRGRARKQKSKYFIFSPIHGNLRTPETWESLEEEMKRAYLNDLREAREAEERELSEDVGEMYYQVANTGALLTLDNASQHLHHFCSLLGSGPYVDTRPQYRFSSSEGVGNSSSNPLVSADVTLPISVDPAVRTARSSKNWGTERMAKNDVSFQAYKALHLAGLVNDNLLPRAEPGNDEAAEFQIPDNTPSLVQVSPTLDPWVSVAIYQRQNPQVYHRTLLRMQTPEEDSIYMVLYTPVSMPCVPNFFLHWNEKKKYSVESLWIQGAVLSDHELTLMRQITRKILCSIFQSKMCEERHDFLWLLVPADSQGPWDYFKLQTWHTDTNGKQPASSILRANSRDISTWGMVSIRGDLRKFMPRGLSTSASRPDQSIHDKTQLQLIRTPKRRDFLHQMVDFGQETTAYTRLEYFDAEDCMVDNLPTCYSVFALLAPSILYRYEAFLIAETLRTSLLRPICFDSSHTPLLLRALTSSATGEEDNYQRLEFLGDCILKFISSVHLMAANLTWPESFLTGKKGKVVSNGFLARATMSAGLDKFVITKRFTGAKWTPRYAADILNSPGAEEKMMRSSKLIADVIESLIGASYVAGGFPKAFVCVQTLLPLEPWTPIFEANTTLYNAAPTDIAPANLAIAEELIGHTFTKKMLLLEALTHASYSGPIANFCSYERLEFLGDAILDYLISRRLYAQTPPLSHQKMHAMRSAMANASFLAFRMFETTIVEDVFDPTTMIRRFEPRALWMYMRYSVSEIAASRALAIEQHNAARETILHALERDAKFPWHLLSLTDAPKFLSDIVESVIGAVYVDSQGNIEACEAFVRKLGIMDALERILRDGVDCLHPKERLGHLAVEKSVQYVKITDGEDNAAGNRMYKVQVKVGGENVGGVEEGLKRLNAETIAAYKAIRIMEGVDDAAMGGVEDEFLETEDEWFDAEEGEVGLSMDL